MSKTFNKNIPYTFSGAINLSTSANLVSVHNSNTIANIITTGGNVGIGKTTPAFTVDIIGTLEANNGNGVFLFASSGNVLIGTTNNANVSSFGTGNLMLYGTGAINNGIAMNGLGNTTLQFLNAGTMRGALALVATAGNWSTDSRVGDMVIRCNTNQSMLFNTNSGTGVSSMIISGGNVGIGVTAPSSRLHVVMGDATSAGSTSLWDSTYSVFGQASNTGGAVGIGYNSASGGCLVSLSPNVAWKPMTYRGANHQFVISGSVGTPPSMILNSSGNLGIGTTAPQTNFHVAGGGFQLGASNTAGVHMQALNGALNVWRGTWGAGTVTFCSDSRGNFGIGTHSPAYALDVTGSLRSTGDIFIGNGTNAEALNLWDIPGAAWQLSTGSYNLNIRNGTAGSTMVDRVTITSTGNVGIGTTTPIGKISVDYSGISTNQNVLSLHTSNTGTTDYNLIEAGHGASTTFVLKGNGNVGIGTTSPSEKLHINGNIILGSSTADSNVDYTISTPGQLTINANNASTQDNTFVALTLTSGVSSNQSNIILCGSANNSFRHIAFSTMNTERMRLSSAGNVGIGTSTPAYPLDIINTVSSSNQPFMRIGNSAGGAGNQVGIILSPFSPRTGGASSQIISIDDGNASAHLTLWTAPSGTGTASVERVRIQNNGNVGIGTVSPAFTLDVNGTIARSGVKLPRYDNGSFSGAASFSIPILFNDTQYNYAEFRVRYVTSNVCNINISATSYVNAAMNFGECALTTVKWNAQGTPVYATFSGVTSGIFADTVEMVGIDNNLIFRIVRATGTSSTGLRNHYSYDNVYCWSGVGTARGYGQGHIDNASVGGSPLQFVTFTCSTGTISGTYSSVHYY